MDKIKLILIAVLFMCCGALAQDRTTISEFNNLINEARKELDGAPVFLIFTDDPFIMAQTHFYSNSTKPTYIYINPENLKFIETKHEWAFIIFHEISHKLLNDGPNAFNKNRHEAEFACDANSLKIMQKYGYRLDQSLRLIIKYNNAETLSHPSGTDRAKRIREKISQIEEQ